MAMPAWPDGRTSGDKPYEHEGTCAAGAGSENTGSGAEILKNWPVRGIIPFDLSILLRVLKDFRCIPYLT